MAGQLRERRSSLRISARTSIERAPSTAAAPAAPSPRRLQRIDVRCHTPRPAVEPLRLRRPPREAGDQRRAAPRASPPPPPSRRPASRRRRRRGCRAPPRASAEARIERVELARWAPRARGRAPARAARAAGSPTPPCSRARRRRRRRHGSSFSSRPQLHLQIGEPFWSAFCFSRSPPPPCCGTPESRRRRFLGGLDAYDVELLRARRRPRSRVVEGGAELRNLRRASATADGEDGGSAVSADAAAAEAPRFPPPPRGAPPPPRAAASPPCEVADASSGSSIVEHALLRPALEPAAPGSSYRLVPLAGSPLRRSAARTSTTTRPPTPPSGREGRHETTAPPAAAAAALLAGRLRAPPRPAPAPW